MIFTTDYTDQNGCKTKQSSMPVILSIAKNPTGPNAGENHGFFASLRMTGSGLAVPIRG
jgi:hypothetical protein